jgi:hypothetical protein
MRVLTSLLAIFWVAHAAAEPPPRGDPEIYSVMPAFWSVMDSADSRAARFRQIVIEPNGELYGPVVSMGADFSIEEYLSQLDPLLPVMREVDARMHKEIVATLRQLYARVGAPAPMTIYIAPSLFTSNGQVRVVDGQPKVMFGVDVQAYAELELLPAASRYDMRAYVAHELFHAHHYGVNEEMRRAANTLFDTANPAPLYLNLWIEGLATCASMSMDGDGPIERALMSERLPRELPPVLPALAREMAAKLDSRSLDDTRDFFWMGSERKDIPPRSAYAVGALVADDILKRRSLAAALQLSGEKLRGEVGAAMSRLVRRNAAVNWSAVCNLPARTTPRHQLRDASESVLEETNTRDFSRDGGEGSSD